MGLGKVFGAIAGIAIVALGTAIAGPIAGAIFSNAFLATTLGSVATALIATGVTAAGMLALKATGLMRGTPTSQGNLTPQVVRQSLANGLLLYGERRVTVLDQVFFHSKKVSKRHRRYFVFEIASHRIAGNPTWFLNDEEVTVNAGTGAVTSGPYAGSVWLWLQRGLATETANATFVSECDGKWTSAHRGDGVAAIYMKAELTDDVVEAGFPIPSPIVQGCDEIFDYRDDSTGYSNNAVLVVYDFIRRARNEGGFGAYDDEIPDADWIGEQADICDETVNGEPRYTLNGLIEAGAPPSEVRDALIVNMAGTYAYVGGKHLIRCGAWNPVSHTFQEDDFSGPLDVRPMLTGDVAATEVQGTYVEPSDKYQGAPLTTQSITPIPDDIRQMDLDFAFITNKDQADRVASIMLNRAQRELRVTAPLNIVGLKAQALDTVVFNTARYGIGNYAFSVEGWSLAIDENGPSILIVGREEDEDIYTAPALVAPPSPPAISTPETVETDASTTDIILNSSIVETGVLTAADVGATATITIGAHTRRYLDGSGDVAVTGGSLTGKAFATEYFIYYDDPTRAGGAVTYASTTTQIDSGPSPTNPFRHYVGRIRTPADGAASTTGTGGTAPWIGEEEADQIAFAPTGGISATNVQAAIAELDTEKLAASGYTAADVLTKLLTVDGSGSGLDADMFDGQSSAYFLDRANHTGSDAVQYALVSLSASPAAANFVGGAVFAGWDTEVADVGGWWAIGDPGKLIVPSGVTLVELGCTLILGSGTANELTSLTVLKNGATTYEGRPTLNDTTNSAAPILQVTSGPIIVTAGDYFQARLAIAADTTVQISGGAGQSHFWIRKLA